MAGKSKKLKQKVVYYYDESDDENEGSDSGEIAIEKLNLALRPEKKLLVLGLGGLLCLRVCRKRWFDVPKHCSPDASFGSIFVYKRPYCEDFIDFCMERFEVGIWSSAKEWYFNSALDCLMRTYRHDLLFAWDQNECTYSGFDTLEKKDKPLFLKELKKVWKRNYLRSSNGHYDASNTFLIDNQPYKALLNPPNTGIFLADYEAEHVNDTELGPNGELRAYLEGLAKADDVQSYVKKHPFGEPAITAEHPSWDYYHKIIRHLTVE